MIYHPYPFGYPRCFSPFGYLLFTFDSALPKHLRDSLPQIVPQKHIQAPEGGDLRVIGGGEEDGGVVAMEVLAAHVVGIVQQQEAPGGDRGLGLVDGGGKLPGLVLALAFDLELGGVFGGIDALVEMAVEGLRDTVRNCAQPVAHGVQIPVELLKILRGQGAQVIHHVEEVVPVGLGALRSGAAGLSAFQLPEQILDTFCIVRG